MTDTFDFGDGNGHVPAHKHSNGGGWVAATAKVKETAFVGPDAVVYGNAHVLDSARIEDCARVYYHGWVQNNARIYGSACIHGFSHVEQSAEVCENARIFGGANVSGNVIIGGDAEFACRMVVHGDQVISEGLRVYDFEDGMGEVPAHMHLNGGGWVADTAHVDDTAEVMTRARVYGHASLRGTACAYSNGQVYGYAQIYDDAGVGGDSRVCGRAHVFGSASISGKAIVGGAARVSGRAHVGSNRRIAGCERVFSELLYCGETPTDSDREKERPHLLFQGKQHAKEKPKPPVAVEKEKPKHHFWTGQPVEEEPAPTVVPDKPAPETADSWWESLVDAVRECIGIRSVPSVPTWFEACVSSTRRHIEQCREETGITIRGRELLAALDGIKQEVEVSKAALPLAKDAITASLTVLEREADRELERLAEAMTIGIEAHLEAARCAMAGKEE